MGGEGAEARESFIAWLEKIGNTLLCYLHDLLGYFCILKGGEP